MWPACRLAEYHKKRKAEKKEERKEQQAAKKQKLKDAFAALTPEEQQTRRDQAAAAAQARAAAKADVLARLEAADKSGPRLIIDLEFWALMTPQEQKSLVSQLAYCCGHNRRAEKPCSLHFTRCCSGNRRVPDWPCHIFDECGFMP